MAISWENSLRLGIVHTMLYPDVQSGQQSFFETVKHLSEDDFFSVLELNLVRDPALRKAVKELAETSHIAVAYGAQAALLGQKLDVNSLDESERGKAVNKVKSCIDEASELGAERVSLLGGPDPGEARRKEATRALLDSLKEICAYGEQKHLGITLETFDRDVEKKCLIGPAREAAGLTRTVRRDFRDFGILYDMAHGTLLNEDPRRALALLSNYLVHIHVGNCVKTVGSPAYGDKHPRFGVKGGDHDVDDLTRFMKILFDVGYLREKTSRSERLPMVGFEVKPLPGENSDAVLASTKRVWRQAWAQLQMGSKTRKRHSP